MNAKTKALSKKKIKHSESRMLNEHLRFIGKHKADAFNLGNYQDDNTIGSKTDKGYFETKYSRGKYVNKRSPTGMNY